MRPHHLLAKPDSAPPSPAAESDCAPINSRLSWTVHPHQPQRNFHKCTFLFVRPPHRGRPHLVNHGSWVLSRLRRTSQFSGQDSSSGSSERPQAPCSHARINTLTPSHAPCPRHSGVAAAGRSGAESHSPAHPVSKYLYMDAHNGIGVAQPPPLTGAAQSDPRGPELVTAVGLPNLGRCHLFNSELEAFPLGNSFSEHCTDRIVRFSEFFFSFNKISVM